MARMLALVSILALFGASNARAQELAWAESLDASVAQYYGMTVDGSGNVVLVGFFFGAYDFDPGPGTYELTADPAGDAFVVKLDAAGEFVWAERFGGTDGDYAAAVAVDSAGNIVLAGAFFGAVDFDPGPGIHDLSSGPATAGFIVKLDAAGNFVWAGSVPGYPILAQAPALAVDDAGDVYLTGWFGQSGDFDPGPGTYTLSVTDDTADVFVLKLDRDGGFGWARSMPSGPDPGDNSFGIGESVAIDGAGNVYTSGIFVGTVDFDPGAGTFMLSSLDLHSAATFVSKLDSAGNFAWAVGFDSTETVSLLALDRDGNAYVSSQFYGTVDFDPGPGTHELTADAWEPFVVKLDPGGDFGWAIVPSAPSYDVALAVDGSGNVFTAGSPEESFYHAFDASGNFVHAASADGSAVTTQIALGSDGSLHLMGDYFGTVDFDPGPGAFELTGSGSSFLMKLRARDADGDGAPDHEDTCTASTLTPTVVLGTCDSAVTNTLLPGGCTIADLLGACADAARTHGQFVSCVAGVTNELRREGVIGAGEAGRVRRCAALRGH